MTTEDGCSSAGDLETDNTIINERVIQEKGLYLSTELIPCEGQVALLDLCAVFTCGFDPTHFDAAVYRPTTVAKWNDTF